MNLAELRLELCRITHSVGRGPDETVGSAKKLEAYILDGTELEPQVPEPVAADEAPSQDKPTKSKKRRKTSRRKSSDNSSLLD